MEYECFGCNRMLPKNMMYSIKFGGDYLCLECYGHAGENHIGEVKELKKKADEAIAKGDLDDYSHWVHKIQNRTMKKVNGLSIVYNIDKKNLDIY